MFPMNMVADYLFSLHFYSGEPISGSLIFIPKNIVEKTSIVIKLNKSAKLTYFKFVLYIKFIIIAHRQL
jgi:hypothetical protein